ncbi:MAG: polysaccharide biosynthesis/export family protein [Acidobacteriaceae bacterium]|nr:polysaccharide biosynthesis/export family protein [Acidobacteriaceae bacterium]
MTSPHARAARLLVSILALQLVVAVGFSSDASAEYRLNAGDILEITVVGAPELLFRAPIDDDGHAYFPMLGQISASDQPLSELRRTIRDLLPTKVFRHRTVEGREYPVVIQPDEISVTVAEYRPVYLNGDVAKPGAVPYRPGLTALQAVALAGGYDVMRFRGKDPFLESADLRSEYYDLWTQFAQDQWRLARLRAELDDAAQIDRRGFVDTPLSSAVLAQFESSEIDQFTASTADFKKEKKHLEESVAQEDNRIAVLTQQVQQEREGADADAAEFAETKKNFQKGFVPTTRLADARRIDLISSTRVLQTTAVLAQIQRERKEVGRKLEATIDQHRLELLRQIEGTEVHMAVLRARLQSAGDKLIYTGMIRSQLVRGNGGKPDLSIVRLEGTSPTHLSINEDAELRPGDVLEVSLRLEDLAGPKDSGPSKTANRR